MKIEEIINLKETIKNEDKCVCGIEHSKHAKALHDLTCTIKNCNYEDHFKRGFNLSLFTNWEIIFASAIFKDRFKQYVNSKLEII